MTPKEYELAVLEQVRIDWPPPQFEVRHDVRLAGASSKTVRQVDVAIFEGSQTRPVMIIEAKKHGRKIDVGIAGSTIALVQDVGGVPAIMVSTSGFSVAAANHLEAESIGHVTITLVEASGLRWIPVLEKRFAVDREFRRVSGDLVEALRTGDATLFLDDGIPYEEWLAVLETGLSLFPVAAEQVLKTIAEHHFDDAYRFNAIQLLSESALLDQSFRKRLQADETDSEILELLHELGSDADGA